MLKDFKPALFILSRFLGIFLLLFLVYQAYLKPFDGVDLDSFSKLLTKQVQFLQEAVGYKTQLLPYPKYETTIFEVNGIQVTRMVEGCNAVSVMIFFAAFVFAFFKGWRTFVFVGCGLLLLHMMNVLRIVILNVVVREFPEYARMAHDYAFPAIIYGSVVVLWLVWIQYFVFRKK